MATRAKTSKQPLSEQELEIMQQQVHEQQKKLQKEAETIKRAHEELRKEQDETAKEKKRLEQGSKDRQIEELKIQLNTLYQEIEMQKEKKERRDPLPGDGLAGESQPHTIQGIEDSIPGVSLREVIDTIPTYDGYNISLQRFVTACRRARDLLPSSSERHLTRLLINKLHGRAYWATQDEDCQYLTDLIDILTSTFGTNKTTDQYRGELSMIYMKPEEHILDYITRVKELRTAVIDTSRRTDNTRHLTQDIDDLTIRAFCDGLPRTYKLEMNPREYLIPSEAYAAARKIAKGLEIEKSRYGNTNSVNATNCNPKGTASRFSKNNSYQQDDKRGYRRPESKPEPYKNTTNNQQLQILQRPQKSCEYCKKMGHTIGECYTKQRDLKNKILGNEQNPSRPDVPRMDYKQPRPICTVTKDKSEPSTSQG